MLMKIKLNAIKIGHIFQIIHTEEEEQEAQDLEKQINLNLLKLIENQPDIDKIYLYAKEPYEVK